MSQSRAARRKTVTTQTAPSRELEANAHLEAFASVEPCHVRILARNFASIWKKTVMMRVRVYDVREVDGGSLLEAGCSGSKFWKVG